MNPRPSDGSRQAPGAGYLEGQLLIAMPAMRDKRFARSVICICLHNASGAMGLIINRPADSISFESLLVELGVVDPDIDDPTLIGNLDTPVLVGGPVKTDRGFVLHSADYEGDDSTLTIDRGLCLTSTVDILKAMAEGAGPRRALLALGYAGWAPGQLETEIQANGWLSCPADADLVFDDELDLKYERALSKLGVDPSYLVSYTGHA